MEMKTYLIETFEYNSSTNIKLLGKIALLRDREESIKLFSHLINCQYKWLARILKTPGYEKMDWWLPVYSFNQLEGEWIKSLQNGLIISTQKQMKKLKLKQLSLDLMEAFGQPHQKTLPCN